jgi:hypothetical protein
MEKVTIFLDIDGPLATNNCIGVDKNNKWGLYMFDPRCIDIFNEINDQFSLNWVLSSDWRGSTDINDMNDYFLFRGLRIVLNDYLMFRYSYFRDPPNRTYLIIDYCKKHNINKFLAIDDLALNLESINFVKVHEHEGVFEEGKKEEIIDKITKQI